MAIVQGLLAVLARSAGRFLNTAFGWATVMLFGKVPQDRQMYLSIIAFGSVIWLTVLVGIAFPVVGAFLLAFLPLPEWVDRNWIRLAMLVAAIIIPLVVGFISLRLPAAEDQPQTTGQKVQTVLKGYPYTLGLAITLILMTLLAPVMKLQALVKRWTTHHIPVVIESDDYMEVVGEVEQALRTGGIETTRQQASWMLRLPTKVLTLLAGGAIENLVADQLTTLRASDVQVVLHPSDMVVSGREHEATRAHAVLTEHLTFSKAYLTWDKEANDLEDKLRAIWQDLRSRADRDRQAGGVDARGLRDAAGQLQEVEEALRSTPLPYEEWEVLFREKLLVERSLLQLMAGVVDRPTDLAEAPPEDQGAARLPGGRQPDAVPAARRGQEDNASERESRTRRGAA
jgi:hypothetical protein